ncbi:MAG: DUF4124 domain-containing protein [Thermomonas sp.]|uniref:DUF4124 domain-containing protein n=1 Tax=Thermomonas sp. TaxID=1971895 RepID=UPI002631F45A|nr:DUF4124 domain-containing protein [Thermomonas sp.]MCC7096982.1 DUF4124 domain-containing protein [Thermomonas sp.]
MRAHGFHLAWLFLLACVGLLGASGAVAQETVFYKCTDASGNVTVQNGTPCAAGMKQEIRRVGSAPTVPVPARRAPEPTPEPAAPAYGEFVLVAGPNMARRPSPEAAALPLPPALFQCTTWDGNTYYGETASPDPRCAPLQVTGIDGSNAMGAGQACEMRQDTCAAIPEDQLCSAWTRRLDEADFKLRYANHGDRREREAARADIAAKIRASRCSPEPPANPSATTPPAPVP